MNNYFVLRRRRTFFTMIISDAVRNFLRGFEGLNPIMTEKLEKFLHLCQFFFLKSFEKALVDHLKNPLAMLD